MALALGKAGKLGLCFSALPSVMVTALGKEGKNVIFLVFLLSISTNKKITYISTHTTADGLFAECLGHSAKALPSAALDKE